MVPDYFFDQISYYCPCHTLPSGYIGLSSTLQKVQAPTTGPWHLLSPGFETFSTQSSFRSQTNSIALGEAFEVTVSKVAPLTLKPITLFQFPVAPNTTLFSYVLTASPTNVEIGT